MIRIATVSDADVIYDIHKRAFGLLWDIDDIKASLSRRVTIVKLAVQDGIACGYICYYTTGDIINIAVLPEWRRRGIGSELIASAIDTARSSDMEYLILEVRESNAPAIKLYKAMEFILIATRDGYYSDGERALIYKLSLQ